jgi:hypothetical protein
LIFQFNGLAFICRKKKEKEENKPFHDRCRNSIAFPCSRSIFVIVKFSKRHFLHTRKIPRASEMNNRAIFAGEACLPLQSGRLIEFNSLRLTNDGVGKLERASERECRERSGITRLPTTSGVDVFSHTPLDINELSSLGLASAIFHSHSPTPLARVGERKIYIMLSHSSQSVVNEWMVVEKEVA